MNAPKAQKGKKMSEEVSFGNSRKKFRQKIPKKSCRKWEISKIRKKMKNKRHEIDSKSLRF